MKAIELQKLKKAIVRYRYRTVRYGIVQYRTGPYQHGLNVMVRYGTVRCRTGRYGKERNSTIRYVGTVLYLYGTGTILYTVPYLYTPLYYTVRRYRTVRNRTERFRTILRYGTVRYGTVRYGTVP